MMRHQQIRSVRQSNASCPTSVSLTETSTTSNARSTRLQRILSIRPRSRHRPPVTSTRFHRFRRLTTVPLPPPTQSEPLTHITYRPQRPTRTPNLNSLPAETLTLPDAPASSESFSKPHRHHSSHRKMPTVSSSDGPPAELSTRPPTPLHTPSNNPTGTIVSSDTANPTILTSPYPTDPSTGTTIDTELSFATVLPPPPSPHAQALLVRDANRAIAANGESSDRPRCHAKLSDGQFVSFDVLPFACGGQRLAFHGELICMPSSHANSSLCHSQNDSPSPTSGASNTSPSSVSSVRSTPVVVKLELVTEATAGLTHTARVNAARTEAARTVRRHRAAAALAERWHTLRVNKTLHILEARPVTLTTSCPRSMIDQSKHPTLHNLHAQLWLHAILKTGNFGTIESLAVGRFTKFLNNDGQVNPTMSANLPSAFAHWSWVASRGKIMMSDIQGVRSARRYVLTDPCIHSVECGPGRPFGGNDLGMTGVDLFFSKHMCNALCLDLDLPYVSGPEATLRSRRALMSASACDGTGSEGSDRTGGTLLATRRWDSGERESDRQRRGRAGRFRGAHGADKESRGSRGTWLEPHVLDELLTENGTVSTKAITLGDLESKLNEGLVKNAPAATSVDGTMESSEERRRRLMRLFMRRSSLRDVMAAAFDDTSASDLRPGIRTQQQTPPMPVVDAGDGVRSDLRGDGRGEGRMGRERAIPLWRKMFRAATAGTKRTRGRDHTAWPRSTAADCR